MLISKTVIGSFLAALAVILFVRCGGACKSYESTLNILKESLDNSNRIISSKTEVIYAALKDKINDRLYASIAKAWLPRALAIQSHTKQINQYISSLLKNDNGLKEPYCFILYDKLMEYKRFLLTVDPEIMSIFKDRINKHLLPGQGTGDSKTSFYTNLFKSRSNTEISGVLTSIKSNILQTENDMAEFCFSKTQGIIVDDFGLSALVGINTTVVQKGDKIEIIAGVGKFSTTVNPQVTIQNKNIPVNQEGLAIYNFKALGGAGQHSVPVTVTYTTRSNFTITETREVRYVIKD